jgi:hypothetical protein
VRQKRNYSEQKGCTEEVRTVRRRGRTASEKAVQKQKRQDSEQERLNSEKKKKDSERKGCTLYRSRRGRTASRRG